MGRRGRSGRMSDLQVLASRHGLGLGIPDPSVRTIGDVAFDQFVFDRHVLRRTDGAAVQRGSNTDRTLLAVASIAWPNMPIDWLAMSSRRSAPHLGLTPADSAAAGDDRVNERFVIDTDDAETVRRLLDAPVCRWLMATDDGFGPIHLVFDGPGDGARHTPTIYLAREVIDDQELIGTLDLVAEALEEFDHPI